MTVLLHPFTHYTLSMSDLPNIDKALFQNPSLDEFQGNLLLSHPPKILLLYGSLRERSFSRLLAEEAERILKAMGRRNGLE
jgi:arsenic resistance protein ArsH